MRSRFLAALAATLFALGAAGCEQPVTPVPHVGDDPSALDLRFTLYMTDGDLNPVAGYGFADVTLTGIGTPDPNYPEGGPRQVVWTDYSTPDPSMPDGWRRVPTTLIYKQAVGSPYGEDQRIYPDEVASVTYTASVDTLFNGWTFRCTISDARTGTTFDTTSITNPVPMPESDDPLIPFIPATVVCLYPNIPVQ